MAVALAHLLRHRGLLGHAPAQAHHLFGVGRLGVGQLAQGAVDPLLRVLPDGAGVDNDDIRPVGVVGKAAAHVPEHAHDALAVRHVLLTAKGLHQGQGRLSGPGVMRGDARGKVPLALQRLGRDHNLCSLQNPDLLSKWDTSPYEFRILYHSRVKSDKFFHRVSPTRPPAGDRSRLPAR